MEYKITYSQTGVGFLSLLLFLFIFLKLTGCVDWSWWIVLTPIWIVPALAICFVITLFVIAFVVVLIRTIFNA